MELVNDLIHASEGDTIDVRYHFTESDLFALKANNKYKTLTVLKDCWIHADEARQIREYSMTCKHIRSARRTKGYLVPSLLPMPDGAFVTKDGKICLKFDWESAKGLSARQGEPIVCWGAKGVIAYANEHLVPDYCVEGTRVFAPKCIDLARKRHYPFRFTPFLQGYELIVTMPSINRYSLRFIQGFLTEVKAEGKGCDIYDFDHEYPLSIQHVVENPGRYYIGKYPPCNPQRILREQRESFVTRCEHCTIDAAE